MYRTIFTPTEVDNLLQFDIPREWYGRNVEVIVFPIDVHQITSQDIERNEKNKFKAIPSKYLFDTKNFKFNRDEANDYE